MTVLGVGIDIVSVGRMSETIARSGSVFVNAVFTEAERKYSLARKNPELCYTAFFALKESAFKTFGTSWQPDMSMKDIEIGVDANGLYSAFLHHGFRRVFHEKKGRLLRLDASFSSDHVIAMAVLERLPG